MVEFAGKHRSDMEEMLHWDEPVEWGRYERRRLKWKRTRHTALLGGIPHRVIDFKNNARRSDEIDSSPAQLASFVGSLFGQKPFHRDGCINDNSSHGHEPFGSPQLNPPEPDQSAP